MKAMILSAGYGKRLGNLTKNIPKPMLNLHGYPILAYIIYNLVSQGFDQIVINLHFHAQAVSSYFGDGSQWGASLFYSRERELLGTGGGIKNVENYFENEKIFLIHYGDVITNQNFLKMIESHNRNQALATLLLHKRSNSNSVIELDADSRIASFHERPIKEAVKGNASSWVNSGICLCTPEIFQYIPEEGSVDLVRNVFVPLVASNRLFGFPLSGYRCAIDSPERLDVARQAIAQGVPGLSSISKLAFFYNGNHQNY